MHVQLIAKLVRSRSLRTLGLAIAIAGCAAGATTPCPAPVIPATTPSTAANLIITTSTHDLDETLRRAIEAIETRGLTLVQRIDHAAAARASGLELEPTTVLVFGNPKAGTPLMIAAPTIALDLPLRLVVWQRGTSVQVAYRDPATVAASHGIGDHPIVGKLTEVLAAIAVAATRGD